MWPDFLVERIHVKNEYFHSFLIVERNELGIIPPETAWKLPLSKVPFLRAKNFVFKNSS